MNSKNFRVFVLAPLLTLLLAGCATPSSKPDPSAFTAEALAATEASKTANVSPDVIARFETYNGDFSTNNIIENTRAVYADDVWFRDPFKQIHGATPFEAYLLRGASAVAQFHMDWKDVAQDNGDYYFRWVMTLKLNRDGKNDPPTLNNGISHIRFGPDGRVIFHEDYFDAATFLYEKIPVLGGEIRFIKKRL
jgi:ABC-type transport system substrate-binding protein